MMRIADMHCDTIYEIYERRAKGEECGILENSLHIDLGKMKREITCFRISLFLFPRGILKGKCRCRNTRSAWRMYFLPR